MILTYINVCSPKIFLVEQAGQLKFERFWQRQVCHRQWHAVRRIQRFRRKILAGMQGFMSLYPKLVFYFSL